MHYKEKFISLFKCYIQFLSYPICRLYMWQAHTVDVTDRMTIPWGCIELSLLCTERLSLSERNWYKTVINPISQSVTDLMQPLKPWITLSTFQWNKSTSKTFLKPAMKEFRKQLCIQFMLQWHYPVWRWLSNDVKNQLFNFFRDILLLQEFLPVYSL